MHIYDNLATNTRILLIIAKIFTVIPCHFFSALRRSSSFMGL